MAEYSDVALLLSGALSTRGHVAFEIAAPSIERHVVAPITLSGSRLSSFLCIDAADSLPDQAALARLQVMNVSRATFGRLVHVCDGPCTNSIPEHEEVIRAAWQRVAACFQLALNFGRRRRLSFSWFFRIRPDAVWYDDLPPLHSLEPSTVWSRARFLHAGHEPAAGLSRARPGVVLSRDHLVGLRGCEIDGRSRVCARVPRACLMPDDQFAAVPREWASRYFGLNGSHLQLEDGASLPNTPPAPLGSRPLLVVHAHPERLVAGSASECAPCFSSVPLAPEVYLARELSKLGVPVGVAPFRFRLHPRSNGSTAAAGAVADFGESLADIRRPRNYTC